MPGPLPLPNPYLPGVPGSGLGDPHEFADNVQQNFDALATAAGQAAEIPSSLAPTFKNSWADATGKTVSYSRDPNGFVSLRGAAKSGSSASAVVFTLPAGFRPAASRIFPVAVNAGAVAYCTVAATGDVNFNVGGDTTGSFFDGVVFKAEQ